MTLVKGWFYASCRAVTPGRALPSRSSRLAPPPVEMKVTLSATPARLTALTLSPPPMIDLHSEFAAMVSAMAMALAMVMVR